MKIKSLICSWLLLLLLAVSLTIITAQEVENEHGFDYIKGSERGPEKWGDLMKEWAACKKGKMQSPVDLKSRRVTIVPKTAEIRWFYRPGNATIKNRGHDIMVKWKKEESKIKINGTDYILRQCHWHSPSEHSIRGKSYAMELHMVHESVDKKVAVIGLLYKIGKPDPFLSKLMNKIRAIMDTTEEVDGGVIDPAGINLKGKKFYRYMGSLTTPPCTEGVLWTINQKISTVSQKQMRLLREAVHDHHEQNARPLQPLNGRKVRLYMHKRRLWPKPL